uniref:Transmembrane protein 254 n=1 Tax=Sinocyclocheilus rhinocerous TaxID=307959 RepID=A0A673HQ27_9TELE
MARSDGSSYFRRSSLFWMVVVTLSLSFFTWTVFWPQDLPYGSLGPLGALAKHLVDYHYPVWFLTWVIHLFEALFALKVCREREILHTICVLYLELWKVANILIIHKERSFYVSIFIRQ